MDEDKRLDDSFVENESIKVKMHRYLQNKVVEQQDELYQKMARLAVSKMSLSDHEIYKLLLKIDEGYKATYHEKKALVSVQKLSWRVIRRLPQCMSMLIALTDLVIEQSSLNDISALSDLKTLKKLCLSNNRNLINISALSGLSSITELDLSMTKVSDISALSGLSNLTKLNLSMTKVSNISALSGLSNLTFLDLSKNANLMDISPLSGLTELRNLGIRDMTISFIPEEFVRLEYMFIDTDEITTCGEPRIIWMKGLKLTDQPIELFSQPQKVILDYYRSLKQEDAVPINECKVVFLGDGGAGKSLIIERLMQDGEIPHNFEGNSTPGICISSKKYTIGNDVIELHFWDFGGQAIMHSMHRLFLTNRTLYVVVTNARDNKANEQAWYWIRNIKSFANGAPILLIVNQKDQNPSVNVNVNGLRKEYPALKDVRIVSALKDSKADFISAICDTMCRIVSDMDTVHTLFSKPWLNLMNDLQEMSDDIIKSTEFYEKCEKYAVGTEAELLNQIISWYQDLGVCFYSRKNPTSKRYMVLKPRWLLNALYILVFNGRKYAKNGIIKNTDIYELICKKVSDENIKKVYQDIKYQEDDIQYILTVLVNYEMIFRLDEEHFFIPMLCDENEPNSFGVFVLEDALQICFEYAYLPENVLHKIIVRHGSDLNTKIVWRTGAMFYNKRCGWTALVRIKDNYLEVFARSKNPETHPVNVYLDMLRESICKINDSFGITAKEFVTYRKGDKQDRFEYEALIGYLDNNMHVIYSTVYRELISIDEILGIVNVQERLYGQGFERQISLLLHSVADALLKLQDNKHYYNADENTCNTYIRDMVGQRGYICYDQSLHSVSGTSIKSGLVDIWIQDRDSGKDLAIYEAQKLKAFGKADKNVLDDHLKRLLNNYNERGLRHLLLASYVSWEKENFNKLASQYASYITIGASAPFPIAESRFLDSFSDTFMRCLKVGYDCGGTTMFVYHMIVRIAE